MQWLHITSFLNQEDNAVCLKGNGICLVNKDSTATPLDLPVVAHIEISSIHLHITKEKIGIQLYVLRGNQIQSF